MHIRLARYLCLVACCVACSPLFAGASVPVAAQLQTAHKAEAAGNYPRALAAYEQVTRTIIDADGEFSPKLIEPLLGSGRTLAKLARYQSAIKALRHAQLIMHRNDGVDTPEQLEIVDQITDIQIDENRPLDANRQQEFALYVSQHDVGKDSPDLLPAIYKLAHWYMDTGQYWRAESSLEQARSLIAEADGTDDPGIAEALVLLAKNERMKRNHFSYKYAEEARRIVDSNDDVPADERGRVYVALADAYVASNKFELAASAFRRAWQLMGDAAASKAFAEPKLIAGSHELQPLMTSFNRYERVGIDAMGNVRKQRLPHAEVLRLDFLPPQVFFISGSDVDRHYHLLDGFVPDTRTRVKPALRVVGHPFGLYFDQLLNVLPFRWQSRQALAKLAVPLDFTVDTRGRARDIKSPGESVPSAIVSLMRRILAEARFRPRIVDGKPVTTKHVTLVQTFKL